MMKTWIDTHLHLLYPSHIHYDWTQNLPSLQPEFNLEAYIAQANKLGISHALHMEVDVRESDIEKESAHIDALISHSSHFLRGFISACRPEYPGQDAFIERALVNPNIRGFRRVLHVVDDHLSQSEIFYQNVRQLTAHGHSFDLCALPRQYTIIEKLISACSHTQFVLDHCGVPDIARHDFGAWQQGIRQLSQHENLACKISGIIAYGDKSRWQEGGMKLVAKDLTPYIEYVVECFGWHRIIWGSDYPVCLLTQGLACWKAITDQVFSACTEQERSALGYQNACRIYRLSIDEAVGI